MPKERTFCAKNVPSQADLETFLADLGLATSPCLTTVFCTETVTRDEKSGRLIVKEMIFHSIPAAENAGRGISDFFLQ